MGADVSITVAFPGPAATEMTAGKVLDERGRMVVDARRREVRGLVDSWPHEYASGPSPWPTVFGLVECRVPNTLGNGARLSHCAARIASKLKESPHSESLARYLHLHLTRSQGLHAFCLARYWNFKLLACTSRAPV